MVSRDFSSEIKKLWNILDRLRLPNNQSKIIKKTRKINKII